MKKQNLNIKTILIMSFGFILAFFLTYILFSFFKQGSIPDDSYTLAAHWNLQINDTVYSDADLSDTLFPETTIGDVVTLTGTLPETDVNRAELVIFSCHSTLNVWINDELVYSYGESRYEQNLILGYGNHYIELPDSYAGSSIKIEMKVSERHSFTSITSPIISDSSSDKLLFMRENIIPFFIGIFLLIFGIAFLFLAVVMFSISGRFFPLLQISLISICIGLWTFCNYHMMQLFTPYLPLCAYLEYISLYVAPIPVLLYFSYYLDSKKNPMLLKFYHFYLAIHSIFLVVCFSCQALNILHFPAFLKTFHVLCVIMLLIVIATPFVSNMPQTFASRLLIYGVLVFALFAAIDLIRFNLEKYTLFFLQESFNGLLPIGAVIFILFLCISFCVNLTDSLYTKAQQELLEYQAHTDSMTGLANRRKCEEVFTQYRNLSDDQIYGIISFDLNNLKQTNDSLGHEYGDQLIITFSRLLGQIFSPYGLVGRMGGDEFAILISDTSKCDVDALIDELLSLIKETNKTLTDFTISTSYGYANRSEAADLLGVFQLADSRMYEYKKRYKGKSEEPELFPGIRF